MCGIAGIFGINGTPVSHGEIKAMCDVQIHRGPNEEGIYIKGPTGLGMRRLSIIDLTTGYLPVHNEDNTVHVVLNGEIYNFKELRKDLEAKGHSFYTDTDTEVIVHLYEEYGADCVSKLRGMYAFAVWDENNGRLLLARDRLGIKPLFFGEFGGRLIFASELKSLLQLPDVAKDLNWNALGHLFSTLTTPRKESIIAGVHKLEPGHILIANAGQTPQVKRYWDVKFDTNQDHGEEYYTEGIRERLEESVRLRMVSDVPFGAFLSGGIDSSAVVATMARQSSVPIKTFSIGFPEKEYNEAPYAKQVADALGTEHHELILEPDVLGIVDKLVWFLDEPFGDSSAIPTYMVSKLAAEHVTVVLSGDGGDEIFAGYERYQVEQKEQRYNQIPKMVRNLMAATGGRMKDGMKGKNFLRHIGLEGTERYLNANTMFGIEEKTSLFSSRVAEMVLAEDPWREFSACIDGQDTDWLSAIQYFDIHHYLPQDILTKVDRASMANCLEARVPLLDHKLVEFAATIPAHYRLHGGSTKHIFKQAMRGVLPDSIIDRRKQGFAVPLGRWFRGELNQYVRDILLSETSRARDIFNPVYIEKLLTLHEKGRPMDLTLWTLISFELWCQTFLDRPAGSYNPSAHMEVGAPTKANNVVPILAGQNR